MTRHSKIKPDPEMGQLAHRSESSNRRHHNTPMAPTSISGTVDQLRPFHRSDAPAPTENLPRRTQSTQGDTDPVFLEVRNRHQPADGVSQNESFFNSSFRDIGQKLKACNDTLGALQQLGVSHDVSLPELVLVGDQSAGKSSLMSGLAGLELPRSHGVCTRCPIHIRVSGSSDGQWSCRVTLQQDYAYRDIPVTEADVSRANPFPPWEKQSRSIKDFKTIFDKKEIEEVLRWAQVATLNHDMNHEMFIPGSAYTKDVGIDTALEETTAKFSPNTVALEIKGPDLPDLSFYDLPGIFEFENRVEDQYRVEVVKNLTREYISHKGAFILWAFPMNSDTNTSLTFKLIREKEALGRTIGVMTKADLLPTDGSHSLYLNMLNGSALQTGLGYFITSRPPKMNLEDLQKWEEGFFRDNIADKWPAEFSQFTARFGVERLKGFLSKKLGQAFAMSLPHIKDKVVSRLNQVNADLGSLPELPDNLELEVRRALMNFSSTVKTKVRDNEFSAAYGRLSESFQECILFIKPKFVMRDPDDIPVLDLTSDDDSDIIGLSRNKRGQSNGATSSAAKRVRVAPATTPSAPRVKTEPVKSPSSSFHNPDTPSGARRTPALQLKEPFVKYKNVGSRFRTLRRIREDIVAKTKAGMPNIIPDEVYGELCKEAVKPWNGPMTSFLDMTMALLNRIVKDALVSSFGSLQKRAIFMAANSHMDAFLVEARAAQQEFLENLYDMETAQLFTLNKESFTRYEEEERRHLTHFRHTMRWNAFSGQAMEQTPWDSMTEEQRTKDEREQMIQVAKMGPDRFKKELGVAAYVKGYYRLAALRFADNVSLSLSSLMFPKILAALDCYLDQKLGLVGAHGPDVYESLMEEDPNTATQRRRLKVDKEKFERALESIIELERQSDAPEAEESGTGVSEQMDVDDGEV